jgi:hypothetical protein
MCTAVRCDTVPGTRPHSRPSASCCFVHAPTAECGCIGRNSVRAAPQPERQLLVEIAVEQAAVPSDADGVAAHHALRGTHVEAAHQQLRARFFGQLPLRFGTRRNGDDRSCPPAAVRAARPSAPRAQAGRGPASALSLHAPGRLDQPLHSAQRHRASSRRFHMGAWNRGKQGRPTPNRASMSKQFQSKAREVWRSRAGRRAPACTHAAGRGAAGSPHSA